MELGKKIWAVGDGFMSSAVSGELCSHEAVCVLNVGDTPANLKITVYFEDRDPLHPFVAVCGAKRTNHVRLDRITNGEGEKIPHDVPYALLIESDVPVIVQHSRLDVTQADMSFMTTIAY